jgi:hypothetical protein
MTTFILAASAMLISFPTDDPALFLFGMCAMITSAIDA